jgi:DNA-binding beta-propeller fold protein YncE
MSTRRILGLWYWAGILACAVLFVSPTFHAAPQGSSSGYHVIRNVLLGGEGSWDYLTVDPEAKRIYIPRSNDIMVVDEVSGKVIGDITGLSGLHAIQVIPELNRGFATGNEGTPPATGGGPPDPVIYVIDLKTLMMTGKIIPEAGAKGNDSEEYDPVTKRVFAYTAQTSNVQVIDAASAKIVGTVTFPGRPEGSVPDGKGSMFVQIADKSEMQEFDTKTLAIKNTWPSAPCGRGVGLAMDKAHRRLFLGCRATPTSDNKDLMVVMNADNGKVITSMPIGAATDGAAYDPATGDIFISSRDGGDGKTGLTNVFHEDSPDKYSKVADIQTLYGARTLALDPKTHHVFLVTTAQNEPGQPTPQNQNPPLRPVQNTFTLVEIGK